MKRPFIFALIAFAVLENGCVVSETERGPGPGDQKKESSPEPIPEPAPSEKIPPSLPTTTPEPSATLGQARRDHRS